MTLDKKRPRTHLTLSRALDYVRLTRPRPGPTRLYAGEGQEQEEHEPRYRGMHVVPPGSERCVCDPFFWQTSYFPAEGFDLSALGDP